MPLVYNTATPPRKLYVLRRISTSEILNRFVTYPNAVDDAPIVGLDPDLEYLAIDRDETPNYDSRAYLLVTGEAKVGSLWRITYTTPKKANDQIKVAIQNREVSEIEKHLRNYEREKMEILGLAVLFQLQSGVVLNARQTAIKNRVLAAAQKLFQNDQTAADKFAVVDANGVPDFDADWAAE
jgi:hypothetical protein